MAAFPGLPFGIVLPQFNIEPVQATRRPDVEGVLSNLPNRGDASQSQKEAEVVREVLVGTGDRLAVGHLLSFKIHTVSGKNELGLGFDGGRALPQCGQRPGHVAGVAGGDVDVVGLEYPAQVGLVGCTGTETLDGRLLVAKGFEEGVGEVLRVEWLLCQQRHCLFNFNGVQGYIPPGSNRRPLIWSAFTLRGSFGGVGD